MSEMEVKKPELTLYNTMTQLKQVFKPINPGKIGMYVCGITAYDFRHIGHARAAVSFDVLYRYLRHLGYEVTYVRNFTDVDDKVIERANKCGENPLDLSNRFCEEYLIDMDALQCLLPTHQPRVSDHMEHIVKMIEKIIENGCGYAVGDDVFFSVDKSPNYGQLSGQRLDHTQAGKRVAVGSRKRNPADFALWKAAKPDEPSWESPWGPGRPGWHIECSAMSAHYLSPRFDIHGGGTDLKFPHHENEIAQTCAACEDSGVNYWLHNGHVTNNNVEMGNSLNISVTIREIMSKYHPLALRYFLMSAHYRSPLTYSVLHLERSSDALGFVYQTLQDLTEALSPLQAALFEDGENYDQDDMAQKKIEKLKVHFRDHMSDDINTVNIFRGEFEIMIRYIKNVLIKHKTWKKQRLMTMVVSLVEVKKAVEKVLEVLGLLSAGSYAEILKEMKVMTLARMKLGAEEILHNGIALESCYGTSKKVFLRSVKVIVELMEFITPAGNVVYYVRKSLHSELEARNEYEVMLRLKGAIGVVQCFGSSIHKLSIRHSTFYAFYMEYASAGTLWDEIQRHPNGLLPIASIRQFTRMILQALKSIHGAGFVHGDLHSGNVLLFHCEEGLEVKISDFGRTKKIGDKSWWSPQSCHLGCREIMSPESVDEGITNEGVDVWAVGHLMKAMLTKNLPNEEATDFKNMCLVPEPERRASVSELLEHNFLLGN